MKNLVTKFIYIFIITLLSNTSFAGSITSQELALREIDKQDRYLAMAEQESFNKRLKRTSREEVIDDAFDLMEEANKE